MTQEQVKIWHDYNDACNGNEIAELYGHYKKRKAQKAQIKEDLRSTAWYLEHG